MTIGACALSARTYNAEEQGSDARLRNHFVLLYIIITYMYCVYGLLIFEIIFMLRQYIRQSHTLKEDLTQFIFLNLSQFVARTYCVK